MIIMIIIIIIITTALYFSISTKDKMALHPKVKLTTLLIP